MVDKKGQKSSYISGTLITVLVVVMLIILGPAQAVSVIISGLQPSYPVRSSIQFQVSIGIIAPDQFVPVTNISLNVTGATNLNRIFSVDGTPISGDSSINITPVSYPSSTDYGYGRGYDNGTRYDFGNGTGYGSGTGDLFFIYNVTINTTSLPIGSYSLISNLNTGKAIKPAFSSTPAVFTIIPTLNAIVNIDPDVLSLKEKEDGKSVVTAYIELPEGYNAADIVVSSIKMNGTVSAEQKPTHIGDHNNNSIPDLMVKFRRTSVIGILSPGDNLITITGNITNGVEFKGSDRIKVRG